MNLLIIIERKGFLPFLITLLKHQSFLKVSTRAQNAIKNGRAIIVHDNSQIVHNIAINCFNLISILTKHGRKFAGYLQNSEQLSWVEAGQAVNEFENISLITGFITPKSKDLLKYCTKIHIISDFEEYEIYNLDIINKLLYFHELSFRHNYDFSTLYSSKIIVPLFLLFFLFPLGSVNILFYLFPFLYSIIIILWKWETIIFRLACDNDYKSKSNLLISTEDLLKNILPEDYGTANTILLIEDKYLREKIYHTILNRNYKSISIDYEDLSLDNFSTEAVMIGIDKLPKNFKLIKESFLLKAKNLRAKGKVLIIQDSNQFCHKEDFPDFVFVNLKNSDLPGSFFIDLFFNGLVEKYSSLQCFEIVKNELTSLINQRIFTEFSEFSISETVNIFNKSFEIIDNRPIGVLNPDFWFDIYSLHCNRTELIRGNFNIPKNHLKIQHNSSEALWHYEGKDDIKLNYNSNIAVKYLYILVNYSSVDKKITANKLREIVYKWDNKIQSDKKNDAKITRSIRENLDRLKIKDYDLNNLINQCIHDKNNKFWYTESDDVNLSIIDEDFDENLLNN